MVERLVEIVNKLQEEGFSVRGKVTPENLILHMEEIDAIRLPYVHATAESHFNKKYGLGILEHKYNGELKKLHLKYTPEIYAQTIEIMEKRHNENANKAPTYVEVHMDFLF